MIRMKRESPARQAEADAFEQEVRPEAQLEAEASAKYVAQGELPAVEGEAEAKTTEPTASEQAFEDQGTADHYNMEHPQRVAEFNQLTASSCMKHGKLDIEKVRDFQKAAHLEATGKVDVATLAAATRASAIREKTQADEAAAEAKPRSKKAEPQPKQPEVIAAPEVAVSGAPEVVKGGESRHQAAIEFNERHAALVAEFNQVTKFACTLGGAVDIEKVMEFQIAHGCKADGRIDAKTLAAAQKLAEPIVAA
jgi:hypothetical protein